MATSHTTSVENGSCTIDDVMICDADVIAIYGMSMHRHWDRYRDVIDDTGNWLYYGIGVYITLVSLIGAVASAAVITQTALSAAPSGFPLCAYVLPKAGCAYEFCTYTAHNVRIYVLAEVIATKPSKVPYPTTWN